MTIDGTEMVVLTLDEYEHLKASRRQVSATSSRVRSLSQRLTETNTFRAELQRAVADLPACPPDCATAANCARNRVLALFAALERRATEQPEPSTGQRQGCAR